MPEGKYGRLYTEDEVVKIVEAALLQGGPEMDDFDGDTDVVEAIFGRAIASLGESLTFPRDEPLFLLRGQDRAAPSVLLAYLEHCDELGAPEGHLTGIRTALADLQSWQASQPWRVKVPD